METIGRHTSSNFELAQIFPEAGACLRRLNKEYSNQINSYDPLKNKILEIIHQHVRMPRNNEILTWLYLNVFVNIPIQELLNKIEKNKSILRFIKQNKDIKDGVYEVTDIPLDQKIEMAKQIPITNFITFNRAGEANCLWHNDNSPSLKHYPKTNSVFCWSRCQKARDVIDAVMEIYTLDFIGAVNFLVK